MERPSLVRLLEELLGRRLSREAQAHAARHILRCSACRGKLSEYRRIRRHLPPSRDRQGYESQ